MLLYETCLYTQFTVPNLGQKFKQYPCHNSSTFTLLQVFLLTVAFGLFHGVVFFPVLLSLCGPDNDNALDNGQVGQTSAAAASVEAAGEDPSSAAPTATTAIEVSHIGYNWFMINTKFRKA